MEINTPFFSGVFPVKRMAEVITVLSICLSAWIGYLLWQHTEDSKRFYRLMWTMRSEQRFTTCVLATPAGPDRLDAFSNPNSVCRQISGTTGRDESARGR